MTVQINYKNGGLKNIIGNHVLFVGEKFNIKPLKKLISDQEFLFVNDLLKTSDFKKNILTFDFNKIIEFSPKIFYICITRFILNIN